MTPLRNSRMRAPAACSPVGRISLNPGSNVNGDCHGHLPEPTLPLRDSGVKRTAEATRCGAGPIGILATAVERRIPALTCGNKLVTIILDGRASRLH
jgi:hypothetical protein